MRRYGFAAEAAAVARDISRAASHFLLNQLLPGGALWRVAARRHEDFPVQYLGANVPQAWAAGTPFLLLQAMLGLQQDAPRGKLNVDPALPDWLPDVTLTDLRLGRQRFDIRFWRDGKDTLFKVLTGKRDLRWSGRASRYPQARRNEHDRRYLDHTPWIDDRWFPAVAGAVAATSSAKRALAQGGATERLAYVGCYTPPGEGIVLYRVNADTGAMTQVKVFSGISNPSWIALDPLHRVLYAVNEDEPSGGVSAFAVDHASGDLEANQQSGFCTASGPVTSAFIHPASSCWWRITVLETSLCSQFLPTAALRDPTDMESDTGPLEPGQSGRQPSRQFRAQRSYRAEDAHDPDRSFRAVRHRQRCRSRQDADLDTGSANRRAGARRPRPSVPSTPGSAPRHFAFLPNGRIFYNLLARAGRYRYRRGLRSKTGAMKEKQSISGATQRLRGQQPVLGTCGLSGLPRFVYAAARRARRHRRARGECRRRTDMGERSTGAHADYPRSFAIDPAGRFLFACNQKGDAVTSFQIDPHSGGLTFTGQFVAVGAPVTMTFLS